MKRRDFLLGTTGIKAVEGVAAQRQSEYIELVNRAHQGDTESMVALGDIYSRGSEHLGEDRDEAYVCYYLAAKQGHDRAREYTREYEDTSSAAEIQILQQDAEKFGCGMLALDGCFITTAVCEGLGKSDDCEELKVLRYYRDTFLLQQKNGRQTVHEYYRLAPMIVQAIEQSAQADQIYVEILDTYLLPAIGQIKAGDHIAAGQCYEQMVDQLSKRFL